MAELAEEAFENTFSLRSIGKCLLRKSDDLLPDIFQIPKEYKKVKKL